MKLIRSFVLIAVTAAALLAQSNANKGQIVGTVYDPNQAVVPNAVVKIKNTGTGLTRDLKTDGTGGYRALLLDAGTYQVTAESAGFALTTVDGLTVNVGSSVNLDLVLQVQATSTSVEVGASLINIALPAPTVTIDSKALNNLPINGRRFQDFATLTPTVQVDSQRGQISFVGQRGINSNIMLDGADYNQPFFGGIRGGERSNSIITVPQSAIQEFQVVTTGYSAEYGRSSGGVMNTITKSGANDIHGDAFYQLRHKEMGMKDPVQRTTDGKKIGSLETLQQFGGSVGGPIKRDKLFYFGAIEFQRSRTPRQVLFTELNNVVNLPQTSREAYDFLKSEEKAFKQTNNAWASTLRADYQTVGGDRLTFRYNVSNAAAENAVSVGGALSPFTTRALSNDGIEKDRTHTGTVQFTHLFSPTLLNDLRFTGTYEERPRLSNSELPQVTMGTGNLLGVYGARNFLPTTQDDTRWQLSDALSFIRGTHTFKVGIDYNKVSATQVFGFNQFGAFNIAGSNTADLLDILSVGGTVANRFDSSAVTYSRQLGNLAATMGMHQVAAFAQDSWRVTPKLTLDFGLRWEGQFNPAAEANNTALVNQVKGYVFPNGQTIDPTSIKDSPTQFMPRFGFAWTPSLTGRRTVVRGHTGIFYASTPLIIMAGATNNFRTPPGDVSITLAPTQTQSVYQQLLAVGVDLNRAPLGSLPVLPIETVQRASTLALGGTPRDPFVGAALLAMAPDFQNPRSFQVGLGIDTELFRNFLIGAQMNLVNTVHLQRNRDYNLPLPQVRTGDQSQRPNYRLRTQPVVLRPISTLSSITVRESSARSMYRGLTFQSQYRVNHFQFGANYNLSESFSDDDTERDATAFNYADPQNFRSDYAYSRLDSRHQFNSYFVLTLPVGFEVSGIYRYRSGLPVNPLTGGDTNEEFGNNDRPYTAPGVSLERNSFRNRGLHYNDLRVLKNFGLGETRRIQFSAEFFNLLNIDNVVFSGANGGFVGGLFGGTYGPGFQPNGQVAAIDPRFLRLRLADGTYDRNNVQVGTPLQVQFGLRFFF